MLLKNIENCTAHMEKVYKCYKIAIYFKTAEDSYGVHIDSVSQNNC